MPTIEKILDERDVRGPFKSIRDLLTRVQIPPSDSEVLVYSGVLDSIAQGRNRPQQLWEILFIQNEKKHDDSEGMLLFRDETRDVPAIKDMPEFEKYLREFKLLGFLSQKHPLFLWYREISHMRKIYGKDIPRLIGKTISLVGWLVTRKAILSIKGKPMEFVSFEDETAIFETVFFPGVYRAYSNLLDDGAPLVLTGKVDDDRGGNHTHYRISKKD